MEPAVDGTKCGDNKVETETSSSQLRNMNDTLRLKTLTKKQNVTPSLFFIRMYLLTLP